MKSKSTIFLLAALILIVLVISDTQSCFCNSRSGLGRFCGHTLNLNSSGCTSHDIYQCGGPGTRAERIGTCLRGCVRGFEGQNEACVT